MLTKKSFLFWLKYSLCLITVIALVDYYFYLSYKKKIISRISRDRTLSELELKVGWYSWNKKSSFVNFEKTKKKGIIRVGCFGDSFTQGAEVNDIYDYPSLLQNILNINGYKNVEVINFGGGAYGFHQSFALWEYLGKEYNLDYILLRPPGFWDGRDSTFIWDPGGDLFHPRYIF